jgi:hypothetical protein
LPVPELTFKAGFSAGYNFTGKVLACNYSHGYPCPEKIAKKKIKQEKEYTEHREEFQKKQNQELSEARRKRDVIKLNEDHPLCDRDTVKPDDCITDPKTGYRVKYKCSSLYSGERLSTEEYNRDCDTANNYCIGDRF